MEQSVQVKENKPNIFIFPAATTTRFILMIMVVLTASLFIYQFLYFTVTANPLTNSGLVVASLKETAKWGVSGIVGVMAAAFLVYLNWPLMIIKQRKLVTLKAEEFPDLFIYLDELTKEMGINTRIKYLCNPLNLSPDGMAFGRPGKYYILLNTGFVAQFYTDRVTFRAKTMHELSHIKNKDIGVTYFTVSVWYAFLSVSILPFIFLEIAKGRSGILWSIAWRIAFLTATIFVLRNSILRTRELYADLTAACYEGVREGLIRLFDTSSDSLKTKWIAKYLSNHPMPQTRVSVLNDNQSMFKTGFWEIFILGLITTMPIPLIEDNFSMWFYGTVYQLLNSYIAVLIVIPFTVFIVGVCVWRRAYLKNINEQSGSGIKRLGIALGLGLAMGEIIQFNSSLGLNDFSMSSEGFDFGTFILWTLIIVAFSIFLVRWLYDFGALLLPSAIKYRSPSLVLNFTLLVTMGSFVFLFGLLVKFKSVFAIAVPSGGIRLYLESIYWSVTKLDSNMLGWVVFLPAALICISSMLFKHKPEILEKGKNAVSFNKAVITGALMAIPFIPLLVYQWNSGMSENNVTWFVCAASIYSVLLNLILEKSRPVLNNLVSCLTTSFGITLIIAVANTVYGGNGVIQYGQLFLNCFNMGVVVSIPFLSASVIFRRF